MKDNNIENQIESEVICLFAMCGKKDREYFETCGRNANYKDFTRLMCICMAFDLKLAMLSIMGDAEKFNKIDDTINYLFGITYDYELVKGWIEEFIDGIKQPELKMRAISCWSKKKNRFDKNGFDLGYMLK